MRILDRLRGWFGMKPRASLDAGQMNRLFRTAASTSLHPDREIQYDIATARARARSLSRNDSTIAGFVKTACDNVVGHAGLQLQAKVANRQGTLADGTNDEIERGWKAFGEPGNCTVDGLLSMVQLQRVLYAAKKVDGEVFIRTHVGPQWPHGFALQVIPADMLDETFDRAPGQGNEIRMGVEVDEYGRRVAYHFWKRHPGDRYGNSRERVRVDASEIIHYRALGEAGQTRGYTELAPVIFDSVMLKGYAEAELVLARQAACKGIRYKAVGEEAIQAYAAAIGRGTQDAAELPQTQDLAPGLEEYVAPGWEPVPYDPSIPNTGIDVFGRFILRRMARGLNVSYGSLTGDISDANYSSMRAGLLPERDYWTAEQVDFATQVMIPVYRLWIGCALLRGVVRLDNRLGSMYHEVEFAGRGWTSVDPIKDQQANLLAIQSGTLTRSEICADEGRDFEDVIDRLKHEQEYAAAAGVNIQGESLAVAKAKATTDAEDTADRRALRAIG
jgi:lambda family phage portal protein